MTERKTFRVLKYSGLPDGPVPITMAHKAIKFVHSTHESLTSSFTTSKDGGTLGIEIEESSSPRFVGEVARLPSTVSVEAKTHQRITQDGHALFFKFPINDARGGRSDLGIRFQIRLHRIEDVSQILTICHPYFHITTKKGNNETQPIASQIYQTQIQGIRGAIPSSQLRPSDPSRLLNTTRPSPAPLTQPLVQPPTTSITPRDVSRLTAPQKRKTSPVDGMEDIKRKLMRNYVPPRGSSAQARVTQASATPDTPPMDSQEPINSASPADTVRMTPAIESQPHHENLMDFDPTPPGTMQDLGQASQMIETLRPPSQSLLDVMTTEHTSPSGLDFPAETINYLPEQIQTAPAQDLISFEDPMGDMSQLNDEDREAIDSTYPPLHTGSGGGISMRGTKPATLQVSPEDTLQSELFELAGVPHLYTPSPVSRPSQAPVTANPVTREVVRHALKEYLREEGFRQMVGEVVSILRDQSKQFLHYERHEPRHQYSYASPNPYQYPQDQYAQSMSGQPLYQGSSERQNHNESNEDQEWYQAMADAPNSQSVQDRSPWFQEGRQPSAEYPQPFPQHPPTDGSSTRSTDPYPSDPQLRKHSAIDSESMSDDEFEAMMAEPCEA